MLFYNYNSGNNIEYSEIYTLLLSNYINILNSNKIINSQLDKNENLLIFDSNYINI